MGENLQYRQFWKRKGFLFCFLWGFRPTRNFFTQRRLHHCHWEAANFDVSWALVAIEQWGLVRVPHLLWHGAFVYNGHLRGPVTLTPTAERLAVDMSLPVFTTYSRSVPARIRTPDLPLGKGILCIGIFRDRKMARGES